MHRTQTLKARRDLLKKEIAENLDFLIGSVSKSPSMSGHNLTTKVEGKTKTVYVRKDIAKKAREMTRRHAKLRRLLKRLAEVNWELLKREEL